MALLRWICDRLSLDRKRDWTYLYCSQSKTALPKKKLERKILLQDDMEKLEEGIQANKPYVVIGLGSIPCECLLNASLVSTKAGGCWDTKKFGKVWISYSPDAALYNPKQVVPIAGVIAMAAEQAGIETTPNPKVPMFPWEEYELKYY